MPNQETQTDETPDQMFVESINDINEKLQSDLSSAKTQKRLIEGLFEILDTICDKYDVFQYDEVERFIWISKNIIKLIRNINYNGLT